MILLFMNLEYKLRNQFHSNYSTLCDMEKMSISSFLPLDLYLDSLTRSIDPDDLGILFLILQEKRILIFLLQVRQSSFSKITFFMCKNKRKFIVFEKLDCHLQ
jgi:hypothetical protein